MAGQVGPGPVIPLLQEAQGFPVGGHVPVGRDDDAGGPSHDVVAGEEHAPGGQGEAEVVGGVPRSGHRLQVPVRAFEAVARRQDQIGDEGRVGGLLQAVARWQGIYRWPASGGQDGSRLPGEGEGCLAMVEVAMSDQHVAHDLPVQGPPQCGLVLTEERAGVDDRHGAPAHQIGVGAVQGEQARIARHHPAHQRGEPVRLPVGEAHLPDEGDLGGHRGHARPPPPGGQAAFGSGAQAQPVADGLDVAQRGVPDLGHPFRLPSPGTVEAGRAMVAGQRPQDRLLPGS